MATSAKTWFYSVPEPRPYYIEERVNHTLWKNRLQGVWMSCSQAEGVIKMEGTWSGQPMFFEWVPGQYFKLRMTEERKEIIGVMRQILLGLLPAFSYQDLEGMVVIEWHTDGGEARWKDIQGNPQYQGLRRLSKAKATR
jgi:hypothetical protein